MTFEIFLTIFLVFLNGFFVAAEFAIVKVRSTQLSNLSGLSKNVTAAAKKVTSNLDGYLAATQLGITLASLGLGWVGEEMMTKIILTSFEALNISIPASTAHKIAIPVAFFCITVLHIVFGELAPKSIAIRKPAATTLLVAIPLQIFYVVFRPFIWMLNGFANSLLRLIGIPPAKEQDIHSEEELKLIIAESQEGGAIEETERQLIHNVFDFDDRRVKGILTHRKDIIALNAAMPFDELVDKVIMEGYSRYPVYNNSIDDLIGIIYTKDLVKGIHEKTIKSVNDILRPVFYIPDSMKIKVLLRNFQLNRQQLAIVTDEFGDTEGLVTMEDVLEQLVGDIQDEHDQEQPIVQQVNEHTFIVDAHQNIEEINEYLPKPLPSSDHYDTLSGLIAYYHGSIPTEGEVLQVEDYQLTILKMFKRSAERVQVVLSE
jgi:CBS domain containing-hemolysin-like protein